MIFSALKSATLRHVSAFFPALKKSIFFTRVASSQCYFLACVLPLRLKAFRITLKVTLIDNKLLVYSLGEAMRLWFRQDHRGEEFPEERRWHPGLLSP